MVITLFLLGIPGSGKSTMARYIESHVRSQGWSVERFNDYTILREMFEADMREYPGGKRFRAAEHNGFNVIDFQVFDDALQELEKRAGGAFEHGDTENKLILLEFARNDYREVFNRFSKKLYETLPEAYFLYLNTDVKVCKARIYERFGKGTTPDDYYVPEDIFERYYKTHNGRWLADFLLEYQVDVEQRVKVVENNEDLAEKVDEVLAYIDAIIRVGGGSAHHTFASPPPISLQPKNERISFIEGTAVAGAASLII